MKPTVGVYTPQFLLSSETFIYNQFQNLEHFQGRVFTCVLDNTDRFPIDHRQLSLRPAVLNRLLRRLASFGSIGRRLSGYLAAGHLAASLKRRNCVALIAHFGPGGMEVKLAARLARVPLVTIFHGYDATQLLRGKSFDDVYPGLRDTRGVLIAVSDFIRNELLTSGVADAQVVTRYLGIPLPEPPTKKVFSGTLLQVGRLVEKKGHETSLRALAQALRAIPDLRLRIIGDGPLRGHLESLAGELRLTDRVDFVGDVSPQVVASEMKAADIFLHPSVTAADGDSEGLPMGVLEAMACGLPVLATRHAGIPEAVAEKAGALVDERDHEALANQIVSYSQRISSGRFDPNEPYEVVAQEFDIKVCVAKLEATIASLVGS